MTHANSSAVLSDLFPFPVKPKFKVKPHNTTAYEGYSVMLHCVAIGDPPPTIQWDKNSQVNAFDIRRFKVGTFTDFPFGRVHRIVKFVHFSTVNKIHSFMIEAS
jgi:PTK7 protein tyrosine kinase 7